MHENYDLLLNFDFAITAETNVRIVHNLIAPPGVRFAKIHRVYSHPVALNQCLDFFARNQRMEREPFYDTAGSVKMIMEERGRRRRRSPRRWPPRFTAAASCAAPSRATATISRGFFCWGRRIMPGGIQCGRKPLEDLAGLFHAQHSGSAVPRAERACAARFEPGEDRIAAAAGQAVGIPVLPGPARAARG